MQTAEPHSLILYTHRYNSAKAAGYFRSLDAALDKVKAPGPRARAAHLAVANAEAAAQWRGRGVPLIL